MKNLFVLFLLFSLATTAQSIKVSGVVKDSIGTPLELANVIATRTDTGEMESYAISNTQGRYQFNLPTGAKYSLVASFLGLAPTTQELDVALSRIGFDTGSVWYSVRARDAARQLAAHFAGLHADLKAGIPSIVCMHYDGQPQTTEHFRLVVGFDQQKDEVIFHEPAVAAGAYRRMKRTMFLELWPLKYRTDRWTVIRLRIAAERISRPPAVTGFSNADFAQHIQELKKKLPNDEFHIVVQKPFVVVGDESVGQVRSRSVNTVKWAVDRLKQDFFKKDPNHIIDVWLFRDKASYEENGTTLFGEMPSTPYGYYSPRQRALVMNIATGGGTLVHEIVHPFMAANFPDCPSWFNEGLGSLYEQSSERNGNR